MDTERDSKLEPPDRDRRKRPLLRMARVPRSRVRAFAAYLDQRLERFDRLVTEALERQEYELRARLKTERAELCSIRIEYRRLFEPYL